MIWDDVYAAYPINAQSVWLNNCGTTPTGLHIVSRMAMHFEKLAESGPGADDSSPGIVLDSIRSQLGQLLHANPHDIALVHNTAEGMTMISLGLNLNAGDEILLLENEYPSNVYPWEHWQDRGVNLRFVPMAHNARDFIGHFREAITSRTRVAAMSTVHWCTGMPMPVEAMSDACKERDVLLVLDGSQGVGQVPLNFSRLSPAVLCFSAWKWLLGPLGLGVLVVDPKTLSNLRMPFKGTDSVADPQSYLPYQSQMRATVDRYTYSTANYNDWAYLDESLRFLGRIGFDVVQARILELTRILWSGLRSLGFECAYDGNDSPASGILSVRKPGVDIEALSEKLAVRGFVTRVRMNHLRMAPHVYLSPEQMHETVAAIAALST